MRTVTAHLLEFTLINHFGRNKSEMARMLGIRRPDFNRIYDRCLRGDGGSQITIEALLKLYFKEGYSLDEAMMGYAGSGGDISQLKTANRECVTKSRSIREQLSDESKAADRRAQVLRSAEQFMVQLERTFCVDSCAQKGECDTNCPCQQFCDFVEWMKTKLEFANERQSVGDGG